MIRLTPRRWVLSLTLHHIVSDGWSLRILFGELSRLYEAFAAGRPSPLPELDIQYADFALWQREHLAGDKLEPQFAYWREQLADLPLLDLPTDRPRPPVQSFAGATHHFSLPPDLVAGLRQAVASGRRHPVHDPPHRLCRPDRPYGQDDLPIGVPIAGRTRAELERLIGFFVNTLVFRIDLAGEPDFTEALKRVREVALGAYANQDVPFDKLVETLSPPRDASRNPLCQVAFQLFDTPADNGASGGPDLDVLPVERGTAVFDMVVTRGKRSASQAASNTAPACSIPPPSSGWWPTSARSSPRWSPPRIAPWPSSTCSVPPSGPSWPAGTPPPPPSPRVTWSGVFEAQAARTPDAEAIRVDGGPSLTYAELDRRANQLAHRLQQLGVGPETRVGVLAPRSLELVVGLLATLKAGGAYLPLDPAYPEKRLAWMYDDARPAVVLSATDTTPFGTTTLRFDAPSIAVQPATSPALPPTPTASHPEGVLVPSPRSRQPGA